MLKKLPFHQYLHIEAVNFSTLKALDTSAAHYLRALARENNDSPALRAGRALHAMLLDPTPPEVAIYEGKVRNGKAWEAFELEHADKIIFRRAELETVHAMRSAVLSHPIAAELLSEGDGEVTLTWKMLGHRCKGRLDWLRPSGSIVELKTTKKIHPRAFARDFAAYHYHAQLAFYTGALQAATGHEPPELPLVIAIENEPPYDVAVYRIGYDILEAGQRKIDTWIRALDTCRRENRWPGVGAEILDLHLPEWALSEGLGDVNLDSLGDA